MGRWTGRAGWRVFWSALTAPLTTWCLHAIALWGWHLPLLFWWSALKPAARAAQGKALLYLFTTMGHTGALGALLTLSLVLWYPSYQASASALGLDPLEDQQLGGLVMWVPAGMAYVAAGLALAMRWAGLARRAAA